MLHADLICPVPQPHRLRGRQKAIPAGDNQMHILRQPACQHTKERGDAQIRQEMKIVHEDIAGGLSRQLMAEIIHQQSAAGCVCGADIVPQKVITGAGKGVLCAFPENRKVIRIYADANNSQRLHLCALLQIPVHRCGLTVAHRCDYRGQGVAGDGPQTFLLALGYVDGVQIPFRFWHGEFLLIPSMLFLCSDVISQFLIYTNIQRDTGHIENVQRKKQIASNTKWYVLCIFAVRQSFINHLLCKCDNSSISLQ